MVERYVVVAPALRCLMEAVGMVEAAVARPLARACPRAHTMTAAMTVVTVVTMLATALGAAAAGMFC